MRYASCVVALLFWLVPSLCLAQAEEGEERPTTVETIYNMCKSDETDSLCVGYLLGAANMLSYAARNQAVWNSEGERFGICNGSYTAGSLRQWFVDWVDANPKVRTLDKDIGLYTALTEQWPCE